MLIDEEMLLRNICCCGGMKCGMCDEVIDCCWSVIVILWRRFARRSRRF